MIKLTEFQIYTIRRKIPAKYNLENYSRISILLQTEPQIGFPTKI